MHPSLDCLFLKARCFPPAGPFPVCEALVAAGIFPETAQPNHVLLNEYSEGQGIGELL